MAQVGTKYAAKSAPVKELIRQFVDMSLPVNCRVRPIRATAFPAR